MSNDKKPDATPREWWIDSEPANEEHKDWFHATEMPSKSRSPKEGYSYIHVIEKSAYDRLAKKIKEQKKAIDGWGVDAFEVRKRIVELESQLDDSQAEIESLQFNLKQKEGEIGRAEHRGNTVDYIYDKLENYSRQLREVAEREQKLVASLERIIGMCTYDGKVINKHGIPAIVMCAQSALKSNKGEG